MTFYTVTCLCLALFAGVFADVQFRIIGGTSTTIEEFPFQVSLRSKGQHFCGGAIISRRHILTAAHCLQGSGVPNISSVTIVTGSSKSAGDDGQAYHVSCVNVHPRYAGFIENNSYDDIGVITLNSSITFNRSTKKIKLPAKNTRPGAQVTITGWGTQNLTSSSNAPVLQKIITTVISNSACSAQLAREDVGRVRKEQICTFERIGDGAYKGDSGGPLSANNEIVGVVSFGSSEKAYPDVFARVYSYKSWIRRIIASSKCKKHC